MAPECSPTDPSTCNNGVITVCSRGFWASFNCSGSCESSPATNNVARCTDPAGDRCVDPYLVRFPPFGTADSVDNMTVVNHTFAGHNDDYALETGGCTKLKTAGKDLVYAVDMRAGETLQFYAKSTESAPEDIALYLREDCSQTGDACVVGSDVIGPNQSGEESVTYKATSDRTVYLVVDSVDAAGSGEVAVHATLTRTP